MNEEGETMAVDDTVVFGQIHAGDDAESMLIGYLLGGEALRAGEQAVKWLTKEASRARCAPRSSIHPTSSREGTRP
jgi:hypothetical protein